MSNIELFAPPEKWDECKCSVVGGKKCPVKIFLAGTIDNGDSTDWQTELINAIENIELRRPVKIYNPRREDWPSSDNHREIDRQISWELHHLEKADKIVMNILANSKSPISLMELGLFAKEGRLMVFCPKSFYRYDNVLAVCKRYGVPLHTTNNIEYIASKVCEYIGVDEEAEGKKKIEEERQELLRMKDDIDMLLHGGNEEWFNLQDNSKVKIGWYEKHFIEKKKEFEEKYGEPLSLEEELNKEVKNGI